MGIGLNSINPFNKAYAASMFAAGGSARPVQSTSIFSQNNGGNNQQQTTSSIDRNASIFGNVQLGATSGLNPFASVNKVKSPVSGVSPVNAQANYRNGLAPADNLQNVFAGNYKGKANILNQIAIA